MGGAREEEAPLLRVALPREGSRLCRPLGGLPCPGPAARLRLRPPREGELETAEKHPSLRASDAAVHALPEEPLLHGGSTRPDVQQVAIRCLAKAFFCHIVAGLSNELRGIFFGPE